MKLSLALLGFVPFLILSTVGSSRAAEVEIDERFLQDRDVTLSELAQHSTYATGLWTALKGIVYDVTNFQHPGGLKILEAGGIDGTSLYRGQSAHVYKLSYVVSTYADIIRIGPLVGSPVMAPVNILVTSAPVDATSGGANPPVDPPVTSAPVDATSGGANPPVVPSVKPTVDNTAAAPVTSAPVFPSLEPPVTSAPVDASAVTPSPVKAPSPVSVPLTSAVSINMHVIQQAVLLISCMIALF